MGQRFVVCDRDQSFLMPPDLRFWLPEDHLDRFVLDAVAAIELEPFYVPIASTAAAGRPMTRR
jgi:hypothetical protein